MITPSSLAAIVGTGVKNVQFAVSGQVVPQKNVIIGSGSDAKVAALGVNGPVRIFSAESVGAQTGFGFMLHRLAKAMFAGGAVETWIVPQLEEAGSTQAAGSVTLTGTTTAAGTVSFYIANERVSFAVPTGTLPEDIAILLEDAINDDDELPVTASIDTMVTPTVVDIESKSGGAWGNDITFAFNLGVDEELPAGLSAVITEMAGGAGTPDIQDALDALGTGDAQNENFFTNVIHGYGWHTPTLDALSTYNGIGNDFVGNYKKEVARPFRSLVGDFAAGEEYGLAALLTDANLRRLDRTNGVIAIPGTYNHPQEVAAQAIGLIAVTNSIRAEEGYIDRVLNGVHPGAMADRWTNEYDNRDQAVRGGVGTTLVKNGVVTLQNVITFYRPEDVSPESNGYRAFRNISILQNVLNTTRLNFEREKWKGISIVQDTAAVSNITSRQKARDIDSVIDDLVALADVFAQNAWVFTAEYTKSELQKGGKVALRSGLTGFDIILPIILSGEGGIYNTEIEFDTSIAILSVGGA